MYVYRCRGKGAEPLGAVSADLIAMNISMHANAYLLKKLLSVGLISCSGIEIAFGFS